jgi:two-component system cell cycle sensor histidine kinase PleC
MEIFMRLSGTSGAGALGFRAGNNDQNHQRRSPIISAVATTAFLAASLFVIYDTIRTFTDLHGQLAAIGAALAADITDHPAEVAKASIDGTAGRFAVVTRARLIMGEEPVSGPLAAFVPAGSHGTLMVEAEQSHAIAGIAGRGATAFALAGLVVLSVRRRRNGEMPDFLQRDNYDQFARAIPMGLACWTRSGQLIVCNDAYRARILAQQDELTYHQAVTELVAGGYMKVVGEDDASRLLELHRADGSCLLIDERPLGDGAFMTLISDITERKKTRAMLEAIREDQRTLARRYHEEKLKAEAASRAKTNFLAHLSHDIRTPLNHIIGFAELMEHQTYGALGDPRYVDYVETIKTSGQHLLATFGAILELAELEGGQKALRQDPVLLDEVLDAVGRRFQGQVARAGIRFHRGPATGAVLRGDRLGLTRMIGNIVDNSVRFTRPGGTITLAAFAADDGVVVEITDTGIGMDEERLASLSRPFATGDASFTRDGTGPGLGISIARAIAELSGGHMAIDSSPALGTTVAISLPIEPAAAALVAA